MNKYLLANALILKSRESSHALDKFLEKLQVFLKETKREKLLKDTLNFLKSKRALSDHKAKIISSKHLSERAVKEIEEENHKLLKDKVIEVEINEDLIGGYLIETKDTRIDKSYKKKLEDLYQTMSK